MRRSSDCTAATAWPHDEQKRAPSATGVAHEGQSINLQAYGQSASGRTDPESATTTLAAMKVVLSRWAAWLRTHPWSADVLLAATVLAVSLVGHVTVLEDGVTEPSVWTVLVIVVTCAAIVVRRRWPVAALAVTQVGETIQGVLGVLGTGSVAMLVTAYSVGRYTKDRRLLVAASISSFVLVISVTVGVVVAGVMWQTYLYLLVPHIAAFVFGDAMRKNHERAAHLEVRAERAERDQEALAREQLALERSRIARELHDVVAHSVSTMIIHTAGARRSLPAEPDRAIDTLGLVERTGREAMTEMRLLLGVLRSERHKAELLPQPGLADVMALVATVPALHVHVVSSALDDTLPPAVSLNAYRVIQESLVNVQRHAGAGTHVVVTVVREPHALSLSVVDDGAGRPAAPPGGSGFGIVGMRERVGMFGGTLSAGPGEFGGWRVHAEFPLTTDGGAA
jgi:signal transduction histidine kinase